MNVNRSLNQRIRQALYALEKDYGGGPFHIYTLTSAEVDAETGEKVIVKDVTVINRVIVLPAKVSRDVIQSISQISANKAFVYGGSFDSRTRTFIIDRRKCPGISELKNDDWVVFGGRKYEIKDIQEFEFDTAWVITARHQLGDEFEEIFRLSSDHLLNLTQNASATL